MSDYTNVSQQIVDFFSAGTQIKCSKGEVLLRPGDKSPGVHLIISGFIKNYSISPSDEINIHVFKRKGDVLPLLWALGNEPVKFYTETMTDTSLYRVDKAKFSKLLEDNPQILRYFLDKLVHITKHYKDRIGGLEHKYVSDRLAAQLIAFVDHFGEDSPEGIVINLPVTHQDIADTINSTRETVSRELAKLEDKDLVGDNGNSIVVKNVIELRSQLEN